MTDRKSLLGMRRNRIAITGTRGTGKTTLCVSTARDYASRGIKVLYLDLWEEMGAVEELLRLDDSIIANINYITPKKYQDAMTALTPGAYGFVVVDAMQNLRILSNDQAVDVLISVGADNEGNEESGKGILRRIRSQGGAVSASTLAYGKGTGTQKEFERFFMSKLWSMECDTLVAMNTKSLSASESFITALEGFFDVVVEVDKVATSSRLFEYRFIVEKVRGAEIPSTAPQVLKRGDNIIQRVNEFLHPTPKIDIMPFFCIQHNSKVTLAGSRDCIQLSHELKEI